MYPTLSCDADIFSIPGLPGIDLVLGLKELHDLSGLLLRHYELEHIGAGPGMDFVKLLLEALLFAGHSCFSPGFRLRLGKPSG
jgi:hypothetical protein